MRPLPGEIPERGLLVVLLNPPTGDGARTLARVDCAKEILGLDVAHTVNLFGIATANSRCIAQAGDREVSWLRSRAKLEHAVSHSTDILLAYGVSHPVGPARHHFQAQVSWLETLFDESMHRIWLVGGRPIHPSRWQRHTWRTHPGRPFREALALELRPRGT